METTGKHSTKNYLCTRCGTKQKYITNHWGKIYHRCTECSWKNPLQPTSVWKCLDSLPVGYVKAKPFEYVGHELANNRLKLKDKSRPAISYDDILDVMLAIKTV